jgi:hypothetical protein
MNLPLQQPTIKHFSPSKTRVEIVNLEFDFFYQLFYFYEACFFILNILPMSEMTNFVVEYC